MKIDPPRAVRHTAEKALTLHRRQPIHGVGGIAVAERLTAGTATLEDVRSMRRFFTVNEREYRRLTSLQHNATTQALIRSWNLYGGDSGKAWSEGVAKVAVDQGLVEEDPWISLLQDEPEDVEHRLSFGAWAWEYDMDARKAARFVEEYQRANGKQFDLRRAFGESAATVNKALHRRVARENPFKQLARELMRREYSAAARKDLLEHREAQPTGMRWPSLIAWAVVGCHRPELLRRFEESYARAPMRGRDARAIVEYSEPVADLVAFLHPQGPRFDARTPGPVLGACDSLVWHVLEGEAEEEQTREELETIRQWSGQAGHGFGLAHTLIEAWRRRDWAIIADALPHEGDIRTLFEQFRADCRGGPLEERAVDTP